MKKILLVLSALVLAGPAFAAQTFKIDPLHTQVMFTYNHFGFSNPSALLSDVSGTIQLDQSDWSKSSVTATIPLSSMQTGVTKLTEHLMEPRYFDADKYPDITFKSTKVEKTGDKTLSVTGDVTIHGVTRPITLAVKVNGIGKNPMKPVTSAGFDADATLKRSDFGITHLIPLASDEIHVHMTVVGNHTKQ